MQQWYTHERHTHDTKSTYNRNDAKKIDFMLNMYAILFL